GLQPLPPTGPASVDQARAAVEKFLDTTGALDPSDALVPTRFNPNNPDASLPERRTAAHALWQLAERVKRRLGEGKPVRLQGLGEEVVGRDSSPLVAAVLRPLPLAGQNQLLGQIREVSIAPWEVDAFVRPMVEAAVGKCNRLIRAHLTDNPPGGREQEVDWVVL